MIDDTSEMSPGRASYWDEFYNEQNGLLIQKEFNNRRSTELHENGCLLDHYEWFITFTSYANVLRECILEHLDLTTDVSKFQESLLSIAEPVTGENGCKKFTVLEQQRRKCESDDSCECAQNCNDKDLSSVARLSLANERERCESVECHHEELLLLSGKVKKCQCEKSLKVLHVLHLGCGNSNFCDEFEEEYKTWQSSATVNGFTSVEILNIDVCENLIERLVKRFPHRRYVIGNCCELVNTAIYKDDNIEHWYTVGVDTDNGIPRLCTVYPESTDLIFDKGTADAIMSAFAGSVNPNMESYATQTLRALRPGGICFIITINSKEVLEPYFISAAVEHLNWCTDKCINSNNVKTKFDLSEYEEMVVGKINCNNTAASTTNAATQNTGNTKYQTSYGNNNINNVNNKSTKYYELCYENVIELTSREHSSVRVETIGSRYNCFAFKAVLEEYNGNFLVSHFNN